MELTMSDSEVMRLRRLRNTALKARAIANVFDSDTARTDSVYSRSAQTCWRIARMVTGTLRAHPYISFQRGPSELRAAFHGCAALIAGVVARYRGRSLHTYLQQLQRVARELDDARALTRSTDLSDTLGRSQAEIHGLIRELKVGARGEAGYRESVPRIDARAAVQGDAASVAGNWPYLGL
jgi:hypothetical protein